MGSIKYYRENNISWSDIKDILWTKNRLEVSITYIIKIYKEYINNEKNY